MDDNKILFDDIHTKTKQTQLEEQFQAVSNIIHDKFKKISKINHCPCCKSKNITNYTEKFGFNLDYCRECNHIFTNPYPSSDALSYFYNSNYKKFENQFFKDSFQKRIPIFSFRILELQKYLKSSHSILDIGSSLGIFLESNQLMKSHLNITSCDLSLDACELLKSRYPRNTILNIDFMDLPNDTKFNCITLWDTFEHIPNPDSCLIKIRSLLEKDGLFAFSTPNTTSAEWIFAGKNHPQILPPGHVNLYNRDNIKIILNNHGFTVRSILTPNSSLDISFIKKILNSNKYIDPSKINVKTEYSLEALFRYLLDIEGFENTLENMIKKSTFGGNMFVIASKD